MGLNTLWQPGGPYASRAGSSIGVAARAVASARARHIADRHPSVDTEPYRASRPSVELENMEVELLVRAKDLDHKQESWTMGEDIELEAALDEKLEDIVEMILDRHQLRFPENTVPKLDNSRFDIVVPPDHKVDKKHYHYQLRRIGLTVKDNVLEIHPTTVGIWLWHPMDYYVDQFKAALVKRIGDEVVELCDLVHCDLVHKPPVIRTSTKVFLRKYPEVFLVTTSLRSNRSNVRMNKDLSPPIFL